MFLKELKNTKYPTLISRNARRPPFSHSKFGSNRGPVASQSFNVMQAEMHAAKVIKLAGLNASWVIEDIDMKE